MQSWYANFFNNRCEAIIIQMRRCHITCNKELSADAMMDTWSWIFMLSAAVDKQLAQFFPSPRPSWLSLMAAGAEGQSLVFSRVRWLDCCCKQGTGEASRCQCQCVGLNKASVHRCGVHAQMHGNTKRHSRVWCSALAWLHFSYSNIHRKIENRVHTHIRMLYLYAKQLLPKH